MFDITTMRITKTRAPFVTNYAGKLAVLLIITLLLFKCTTVVARGGHGGGGGHGSVGGGHASVGDGHAVEGGGHAVGGGGGHGEEEEGGHGIGRGGSMIHRPATRNGGSTLLTPFADRFASAFLIITFLYI
ncbi:glycine-rich cell wall structural protein [Capsella rubella]|uniref:glycine-rich cell wall structural protein n=1 Tax=Capsella rubella TaxID=81985 RepID=UPI000CD59E4E|nr:glycine-rich cell wall structural protein [Capsella rubella]